MSDVVQTLRQRLLRELTESNALSADQARQFCRLLADDTPIDSSKLLSIFKTSNDEPKQ